MDETKPAPVLSFNESQWADSIITALADVQPQKVNTPTYGWVEVDRASAGGTSFRFQDYWQWLSFDFRGTTSTDYQPAAGPRVEYNAGILVREVFAGLNLPAPEIWREASDRQGEQFSAAERRP